MREQAEVLDVGFRVRVGEGGLEGEGGECGNEE